ncbi:hypothetical protein R70723_25165 [Paenibacillus sp. FSL R7-0273]|uniref:hypothetical protein n=1 Tax=Paenibacillus sp. FSL R7-0273 TaxID=1536772 RepID=UPI0004F7B030|nr:hypothetical protein [Paenibacillus sp. FSL R7-0273]AIQ48830.1 hypothetical protein R70723_25165 [Paenibacillus sp. FSL R7-0273]OMF91292.1 hypothetical protein BK144_16345 [Paenibacillus sp. FSL R7-0273]
MKHRLSEDETKVMTAKPEWYREAGRGPFTEEGFTPQLMARIELAAERRAGTEKATSRRRIGIAGIAAVMLVGALMWPLAGGGRESGEGPQAIWNNKSGAAVQPSVPAAPSPSPAAQKRTGYYSKVNFELGGLKYVMSLPMDRDKSSAQAVDTPLGIVWSPPPPKVDYLRPGYTRNTEPYTLYLTPKGHTELSAESAQRLYTFPLYAGGAQTYFALGYLFSAGDYLVFTNGAYTVGEVKTRGPGKISVLDLKKASAGDVTAPSDLFTLNSSDYSLDHAFIAADPDRNELLLVDYKEAGNGGFIQHSKLYDITTGKSDVLPETVTTEKKKRPTKVHYGELSITTEEEYYVAHYEVNGEKRTVDISIATGEQWYYDWWYEEYGEKIDASTIKKKL